ncbi:hypothetical protein HDE76_000286 [Rhodanobacter sp. ANJX3]|uniref:YkgJ family cysteine cluster protein n=1 Tax=Rhodanobacter sp. ANJX3 TaxID=2723083 RepID=UPI0016114902|nr:YkgJ family cysteine cluster protein [Rhodanobacter sp. ANJX3]MBB5357104.1 hypothetical protein [Rhodanobacter sp. ANJX3]
MTRWIDNPEINPTWAVVHAHENARRLEAGVSPSIQADEKVMPETIAATAGTPIEQLQILHQRIAPIYKAIGPFTACRRACSSCCYYKVDVYPLEAELIAQSLDLPLPSLPASHQPGHGRRCPFLTKKATCGIYAVRPMVCRQHVMLTETNYWCLAARAHQVKLPLMRLTGIDEAFVEIVKRDGRSQPSQIRDLRDYFPTSPVTSSAGESLSP